MRPESSHRLKRRASLWGAVLGCGVLAMATLARDTELTEMEALNFKVQLENYPPPNEAQIKVLLEGARAQPRPGGLILLTDAKVKSFSTNGLLEMVAQSPRCTFDSVQRTMSSTGQLQIQSADGKFLLQGEGFLLQTNEILFLSNRVHAVIRGFRDKPSK